MPEDEPIRAIPGEEAGEESLVDLRIEGDGGVTLWATPETLRDQQTDKDLCLQIQPDRPVIIGRQLGGEIEYLDPAYMPSHFLPNTDRSILSSSGRGSDRYVSRGHFMLKSHSLGVVFVNGVPRRGGGIRPPLNWTQLLLPARRILRAGEEYLIEHGNAIEIRLPNDAMIFIQAK